MLILNFLFFFVSNLFAIHQTDSAFVDLEKTTVSTLYGKDDFSESLLFGGGYINFGYWEKIDFSKTLSLKERVLSQENLYRLVAKELTLSKNDRVLEIGSGKGTGSFLLCTEYSPKEFYGLDATEEQILRANSSFYPKSTQLNLKFLHGSGECIPLSDQSITKLISIEAVQHIPDKQALANESFRVLENNGKLLITTFFATTEDSLDKLKPFIPSIESNLDCIIAIDQMKQHLVNAGFKNISIKPIGKNVWQGFDSWIKQHESLDGVWTRNWYKCYNLGLIDYYIISAEKP